MKKLLLALSLLAINNNSLLSQNKLNDTLVLQLVEIAHDDQSTRKQLEKMSMNQKNDSLEMQRLFSQMKQKDSLNTLKIVAMLDKYGWLGSDVIGDDGNQTLFLVIQHSNIKTQQKYLPIMREAVQKGKAKARSLALLEDRVALRTGKYQIYGSQVAWDISSKKYCVMPLEDPDNVDSRRSKVGLPPISEYLSNWQLKWDLEEYKKDLPRIASLFLKYE